MLGGELRFLLRLFWSRPDVAFVISREVLISVPVGVVFLQVASLDEELAALPALDLLGFGADWQLQQILVSRQGLLLQFQFTLQLMVLFRLQFDFVPDLGSFFKVVLVLQVQCLGQRFKVVLSVNQVLNRQLGKSEQLHKVSVAHAFHVVSVELGICEILQQRLKLSQVDIFDQSVHVCVQHVSPVDLALALLELELGRQRHQA